MTWPLSAGPFCGPLKEGGAKERPSQVIAQATCVRAFEAGKTAARNGYSAAKTSVRAPELSTDQCEPLFLHVKIEGVSFSPLSGVAPANQTKERSVHELFPRGIPEQKFNVNRACFPKEKHQNSQKWAKFMNFSFWPFLWFGLPGRLLTLIDEVRAPVPYNTLQQSPTPQPLPSQDNAPKPTTPPPPPSRQALAHQNRTIAQSLAISALTEPNRQKSRRLRDRSPKSQIASDFPSHP